VVAGLVTGIRAPRVLSPQNRLSDSQNWRTVELVLEGAVFLTMGLQIKSIVTDVREDHAGVLPALLVAVGALVLTIVVRAAYVAPLLRVLSARARHAGAMQPRVQSMQLRIESEGASGSFAELNRRARNDPRQLEADAGAGAGAGSGAGDTAGGAVGDPADVPEAGRSPRARSPRRGRRRPEGRTRTPSQRTLDQFTRRVTQGLADIEYFLRQPLGWRDGTAVVWAGMRGAVTVAAAQTLPEDTPQRPVLVLIAFAVAALSLLLQGGTIGPLLRRLSPPVDEAAEHAQNESERTKIFELMRESADGVPGPDPRTADRSKEGFDASMAHTLAMLTAQRKALLDARDNGLFDADVLADALANLDASEIAIELRGRLAD
jgi:CPA1 family monovalent cation:H+ antiporter